MEAFPAQSRVMVSVLLIPITFMLISLTLAALVWQVTVKVVNFVIPSEASNLSFFSRAEALERFLASLGMTKSCDAFSGAC